MPEERILPPFPDELVERPRKEDAIRFLLELALPGRIGSNHLVRWSEVTGIAVTKSDIFRVRRRPAGPL